MTRLTLSILTIVCASLASADTFRFIGTGIGGRASVTVSGSTKREFIGEAKFTYGSEPQTYGYCVDIFTPAATAEAFKADTGSVVGGWTIGYLINKYAPIYHAANDYRGAAALQLAVWDIQLETPSSERRVSSKYKIDMTSGNMKASSFTDLSGNSINLSSYFNTFNADLAGTAVVTRYVAHQGYRMQSFASPAIVPEPATLAILGAGAFGLLRRRRKHANRS